MGIDPGTNIMGYGVISADGSKPKLETMGVIMLNKITDPYEKLAAIHKRVTWLIEEFLPDECAIEAPFFGQNVQSMLNLDERRGWPLPPLLPARFRLPNTHRAKSNLP